jgi:putative tricarboxylic transport membrane protein
MTSAIQVPRSESGEGESFDISVPRWRLGVGLIGLLAFIGYVIEALRLEPGSLTEPGPGLFPIIIGVGGIVAAVFVVIEALRAPMTTTTLPKGRQAKDVIFFVVGLLLAVLLLPILGMFIVAPIYAAVTAWGLTTKHRIRGAIISAVLVLGAAYAFTEFLEVRLPQPIW